MIWIRLDYIFGCSSPLFQALIKAFFEISSTLFSSYEFLKMRFFDSFSLIFLKNLT